MKNTRWLVVACCAIAVLSIATGISIKGTAFFPFDTYLPIVMLPAPTPTPMPSGVRIIDNYSYYIDSSHDLHVVGEVMNNTNDIITNIQFVGNMYTSNGQFLEGGYGYTFLEDLPAGDKTCFNITLPLPSDWSYCQFEELDYDTGSDPIPNLTPFNVSDRYVSTEGWYQVIGQVRNDQGSPVENVTIVVTLYDASGTVLGCNFVNTIDSNLVPFQVSPFEITFSDRNYYDVWSYRLQVGGDLP